MTTRKTRIATRCDDSVMSGRLVRFSQNMRRVPIAFVLVISAAIGGGCAITPRISFLSEAEAFGFDNDQKNGVATTTRYDEWTRLADETRRTDALAPIDTWEHSVFVTHRSLSDEWHTISSRLSLRRVPRVVASASPHQSSAWEERLDLVVGRVSDWSDICLPTLAADRSLSLSIAGGQAPLRVANSLPNGLLALSSVTPTNHSGP